MRAQIQSTVSPLVFYNEICSFMIYTHHRSGTQLERDAWKEIFMSNYFVRDAPLWDESYLYRNAISKVSASESLGLTPR